MQWPSHYNHLVYHVPPASLYEQFLKLLNVHKACSYVDKTPALSWQLYLFFAFSNSVTKSRCNKLFTCSTVNAIAEKNLQY